MLKSQAHKSHGIGPKCKKQKQITQQPKKSLKTKKERAESKKNSMRERPKQRKEKQALGPNSGTKRQIALLFTKGEVENLDNSARKRKCEVLLTLIMVFMVVLLLVLLMVFMMVLLMVLIMMMLMVFRMVLLLVFIVLLTVFMMNLIYQRWLQRSTTGSHEFLRLELPRAWEPSVSSSIARSSAVLGSQNSLPLGD